MKNLPPRPGNPICLEQKPLPNQHNSRWAIKDRFNNRYPYESEKQCMACYRLMKFQERKEDSRDVDPHLIREMQLIKERYKC